MSDVKLTSGEITLIQEKLQTAGFFVSTFVPGDWDKATADAYAAFTYSKGATHLESQTQPINVESIHSSVIALLEADGSTLVGTPEDSGTTELTPEQIAEDEALALAEKEAKEKAEADAAQQKADLEKAEADKLAADEAAAKEKAEADEAAKKADEAAKEVEVKRKKSSK